MATESKDKTRKDEYQRSLDAYTQAMKAFHKGDFEKAETLLEAFLEKHASELEIVDRAKLYLSICQEKKKKRTVFLKTFDDYYQYAVYNLNMGDHDEALKLLDKAGQMDPKEGRIPYLTALAQVLKGNVDECFEPLKKAVSLDKFLKILAQNETDFQTVREDERFKAIIGTK